MTGCEWPMIAFVREYAAESLAALRAAIAEANGSFSPKVAACLQMIPEGTSEANEAHGDLCPATDLGRLISMFSSLFGVAVIALPSGIITASYLDELRSIKEKKNDEEI